MTLARSDKPLGIAIFDLDGTLVDTSGDIVAAANHVRSLFDKPPMTTEQILAFVGKGARHLIRGVMEVTEDSEVEKLLSLYQDNYRERQGEGSALYPGIRDCIDALSADFDLFVLSNKPHDAVIAELKIQRIENSFKAAFGAGVLSALKPSPVGVLLAMEISGLPPRRTVMVGDAPQDVLAGRAAGTHVIHVEWGYSRLGMEDPLPDAAIATPENLLLKIYEVVLGGRAG